MSRQRYISNELIHFVGRSAESPDAQFEILQSILKDGVLRASWRPPGVRDDMYRQVLREQPDVFLKKPDDMREGPVGGGIPGSLVAGTLVVGAGLCFCDIPVQDLGIHISHYSPFGISFRKSFLAANGATPVFYIARDAVVGDPTRDQTRPLGVAMDELGGDLGRMQQMLFGNTLPPLPGTGNKPLFVLGELSKRVLALVKGFDASANAGDAQNYYMEREWRMLRNLRFALKDVYRIVLPEVYTKRFREAFPQYIGQLTYAESVTEP